MLITDEFAFLDVLYYTRKIDYMKNSIWFLIDLEIFGEHRSFESGSINRTSEQSNERAYNHSIFDFLRLADCPEEFRGPS